MSADSNAQDQSGDDGGEWATIEARVVALRRAARSLDIVLYDLKAMTERRAS